MKKLTVSIETFGILLPDLIKSGVTFVAVEVSTGIMIEFTGGY
jgi:hypothetical protein